MLANDRINFHLRQGEAIAVIGESGCGKSTLAKVITGQETATAGRVRLRGQDIARLRLGVRPQSILRAMQVVFQNPGETLNSARRVGAQLSRVLRKLGPITTGESIRFRMHGLLSAVKLSGETANRLPG